MEPLALRTVVSLGLVLIASRQTASRSGTDGVQTGGRRFWSRLMRKTLQFSVCETVSSWANTASDAKSWAAAP
jgi:hypothetical protein